MIRIELTRHSPFYKAKKDRTHHWVACEPTQAAANKYIRATRRDLDAHGSTLTANCYDNETRRAAIARGEY